MQFSREMRIGRSWSLSSLSTGLSPPSTVSSTSDYIHRSSWNLSEFNRSSPKCKRRFFKNRRKSDLSCMRFTCIPCLSGDVAAVDEKRRSLLFYAVRYDQPDPTRQLLQAGCEPNIRDNVGKTPLHEAIERGSLEAAKVLLTEGVSLDINVRDHDGQTPFMTAVTLGQTESVRLLHKYGANINEMDKFGTSPIYHAIESGWGDIAEFLLDNGCDVNRGSTNGTCFSALIHNDKLCSIENVKRFLRTDYDFKKDAEWLETDECPAMLKEHTKLYTKLLVRAGLRSPLKKSSSIKTKLFRTLRQLSR